jgi:hypothetical protein
MRLRHRTAKRWLPLVLAYFGNAGQRAKVIARRHGLHAHIPGGRNVQNRKGSMITAVQPEARAQSCEINCGWSVSPRESVATISEALVDDGESCLWRVGCRSRSLWLPSNAQFLELPVDRARLAQLQSGRRRHPVIPRW